MVRHSSQSSKIYKVVGVGRNVTTFEHGRRWAYRNVLAYRLEEKREAFSLAVFVSLSRK